MSMDLDIGPLSWVKGEIDLALERAGHDLSAHATDPSGDGLKKARASMHQAHGALAIVGLDGITEFADAIEKLLAALADDTTPDAGAAVTAAQSGFTALRGYLDDLMAGHPNQPLKLFVPYRAMVVARGQPAPGPAELFFPDLTQRPPKREREPAPLAAEALAARLKAARLGFERGLLKWIKSDPKGIAEMKVSVAMIEMTRGTPAARAYWWIALGVLDALAADGLPDATDAKRFAMRLGAQIKKLAEGKAEADEQHMREALYLAACATAGGEALAIVRAAYRLEGMVPTATPSETERLLPHIRRLRELLAAAKEDWNRLCAGTAAALPPFHEHAAKIAEEGAATGQTDYARLSAAILEQADQLRRDPTRHNESMALEMATALLLAESVLENFQTLDADFAHSADAVVSRLAALGRGEELGMLELPHLDAMSRRAQERLLLESVAREIRSNLGTIEQTLDAFFRDPSRQATLAALKQPIRQIQGALLVLGQDRANTILGECANAIERFAEPGFAARAGDFEDVAKKLSALGFFVTQLQGGAADIDAILEPPPVAHPVREEAEAVVVPALAPPEELAAPIQVAEPAADEAPVAEEALPDFEVEGFEAAPEPAPAPPAPAAPVEAPAPSAEASRLVDASEEELDAELLSIFLEEANEVLATINEHLPVVRATPGNQEALVTLRRSFHTLKGSGRMVGLTDLGEAAWAVEQVMNGWLHETRPATPALLETLDLAAGIFKQWVMQLEAGGGSHFDAAELIHRCNILGGAEDVEAETAVAPAPTVEEIAPEEEAAAEMAAAEEPAAPTPSIEEAAPEEEIALEIAAPEEIAAPIPPVEEAAPVEEIAVEEVAAEQVPTVEEVFAEEIAVPPAPTIEEAAPEEVVLEEAAPVEAVPEEIVPEPAPTAEVVSFPAPPPIRVGDVEVSPTLYNLYLDETREHIATLQANLGLEVVPDNDVIRAAHTTASISAAVGMMPISALARALEDALVRLSLVEASPTDSQRFIFARCAGALEGMLGAVAERRMPGEEAALATELNAMTPVDATSFEPSAESVAEPSAEEPVEPAVPEITLTAAERRAARIEDEIDPQVLPLFLEESVDLMREIGEGLRNWRAAPTDSEISRMLQRALHTLKGSARMAGAMGCGELLHSMEDRIEQATAMKSVQPATIDGLETSYDRAAMLIEHLRNPEAARPEAEEPAHPAAGAVVESAAPEAPQTERGTAVAAEAHAPAAAHPAHAPAFVPAPQVHLRVRADLVDQLVNEAGEVAIARGRIEGEMLALKASLLELTENVIRLRKQLREVEIQAESQMQSQQALATERAQEFDPLEFDRFTRFQEVTRMMAESVNDVATVQQNLLRNLDHANAAVAAQARLSRELSQRMMGVRMVPFESLAERLHRVVRQAAKDSGKRANLDIRHGQTEIDRSVLDKMAGPLEHLLRNSVAHGLEESAARAAAGKEPIGQISLSLAQEGNEIVVSIADDGAGLNFPRIRQRAIENGLITADAETDEATLTQLIFQPGFSTASELTALAGRGVGMDVVKSETASLGGRIEVATVTGKGSTFRIYLPLTLAVTQAVLVTAGNRIYAIPSSMIEQATAHKPDAAAQIRSTGGTEWLGNRYPYHYLPVLLGEKGATPPPARRHWILLVKGGTERVALEVDSLSGNQEVVVKAVGPQLARVPGLAGATVLGNGEVALILNPVGLAARAVERANVPVEVAPAPTETQIVQAATAASVMVVDDSLTVRKISGRLLARHGYHVLTAKDGVDALEQLGEVMPDVMLLDIEMPRMDGFDLARNIRADNRLKHIPIIMITSRTADKHRQHAAEIGVNHYLGKPYDEEELLGCIRECIDQKQ
ncbi:hybrid sensor histidine kinase/response regulator [Sulfuritalea hydrogenivorans]|uniref:Chemotaxis protein CheA n=1 Tax=Sulfuritalea hydrogenivorans sk43H TaxID=1223802 RepID=W0SIA7_9PROT|nr:Hpt domain-containing protein [Sulfuritalea hydrogenivorans]BAO31194.1 response regulator receiver:CheW-like protein:ATP-binding region, ATPase-like:Hpt [Sulfuritalea hydrogenivorans sk43H]